MTKRFLLENSDFDLKYEMRIADLNRVEKTKEDFWDDKEECYNYMAFLDYLYEHGAFLTKDEAEKVLNEQDQEIKELEQELFTERVKRFEDNLAEYGDLGDNEAWQRKFGMSRREANKKAGIIDWELIPE